MAYRGCFEQVADWGCQTRKRWERPEWGVYFFSPRKFWSKTGAFIMDYSYGYLVRGDVPVWMVNDYIRGRREDVVPVGQG